MNQEKIEQGRECGPSLKGVFHALVQRGAIRESRVGPIKTAIKQYAIILGYADAASCPSSAYMLPPHLRNQRIEKKAQRSKSYRNNASQYLGSNAVRNLKNNVSYLLRKGLELKLLSPMAEQFASWKGTNKMKPLPKRG